MSGDRIHLQQAKGRVLLKQAHISQNVARQGLASINVLRWEDEEGTAGQDTVARLVDFLKQDDGELAIETGGEITPVDVAPNGRYLVTRGADPEVDPILGLPRF